MTAANNTPTEYRDITKSISVDDVVDFSARHAIKIVISTIAGAVLAVGLAVSIPKQWSASVELQVGQFYSTGVTGPVVTQIETPSRTVERLKLPAFVDQVLTRLNLPLDLGASDEASLIRRSADVRVMRNADLVQITLNGNSPEAALKHAEAFRDTLIEAHRSLAQPSMDKLTLELKEVDLSLTKESEQRDRLDKLAQEQQRLGAAGRFSESVLLAQMIAANDAQIRDLRLRRAALMEQSNPNRTFNTRVIGPTSVSKRPVYPMKSRFAVAGAVVGGLAGVAISLLIDLSRRRTRTSV